MEVIEGICQLPWHISNIVVIFYTGIENHIQIQFSKCISSQSNNLGKEVFDLLSL